MGFPISALRMRNPSSGGSSPTSSAYRYWRVVFGPDNSGNPGGQTVICVDEVEFRTSVGGADVTGSGTAYDDGHTVGGMSPAGAFANDGSTSQWGGSGIAPFWLAYDFGAGNDKAIVEVAIMPRNGFTSGQAPGQFKVQASSNNTDWIDQWWVARPTAHSYTNGVFTVFTKPVVEQSPAANRTRYFRASINSANGVGYAGAGSILLKTVVNSTDDAKFGTASSRSNFSGNLPAYAFDGMNGTSNSTEWVSNNVGFPEWIQYDFGNNPVNISEVTWLSRAGLEGSQSPTSIDFQTSNDGSTWTTVKSVSGLVWSGGTPKTWTIP